MPPSLVLVVRRGLSELFELFEPSIGNGEEACFGEAVAAAVAEDETVAAENDESFSAGADDDGRDLE